ncbi:phosrestin-2 isoform X1 [Daphnia magna]|uniref:phosrestin-2 isoform X1 n=1 Tax=Daphnia magna TaxID=35525 RepID=UPI001E1BC310|nr:phosrestin-2 isoform X1 [Daphnia magna]
MQTNLMKKLSPSGDITMYIAQREYVDHYKSVDPIDGVVIVPTSKAHGHRLFVEIQLHFRYASLSPLHMYQFQSAFHFIKLQGAEAEEFSNIPFKKMVVVASQELFPLGNGPNQIPHVFINWQTALCKKMANMQGICPFKLEFPQGSPPSLVVAGPAGVSGEPCGLTYQVVSYFCTDPTLPLVKKNTVGFNVRVTQETLPVPLLEQLSLAPSTRPATLVSRQFLLSPGKMQIEMCLDRAVVYYGEKLSMHVQITNNSSRTIRKIKCKLYQVSQLSFATGERRAPLYCMETTEGCPIPPGATLQRTYTLMTKLQPHRTNENLVFEASTNRGEVERLSASTIFPYTDPKEGFAILVSYEAKIKVYMGGSQFQSVRSTLGEVSARVPFFLFHQTPRENIELEESVSTSNPVAKPHRMVRLTSVDNEAAKEQPLLVDW